MSIIIGSSQVGNGKIGYKNLFTTSGVTVTASTEASGYAKENAYDWLGYDWWKPTATGDSWLRASFSTAQTANYMAVWGHDLADHGSSIKPQYSTDGGSTWNDADSAMMPANNNTLFFTWDDTLAADWRPLVTNPATIAAIAGIQIGEATEFPYNMGVGFAPSALAPEIETKTAQSESGAFIGGRVLNKGIKGSIKLTNLDPDWVRDTWKPLIDHVQTPKPFVFSWDDQNHSTESVLAWVTKSVPTPSYSTPLLMDVSLNFEGNL